MMPQLKLHRDYPVPKIACEASTSVAGGHWPCGRRAKTAVEFCEGGASHVRFICTEHARTLLIERSASEQDTSDTDTDEQDTDTSEQDTNALQGT